MTWRGDGDTLHLFPNPTKQCPPFPSVNFRKKNHSVFKIISFFFLLSEETQNAGFFCIFGALQLCSFSWYYNDGTKPNHWLIIYGRWSLEKNTYINGRHSNILTRPNTLNCNLLPSWKNCRSSYTAILIWRKFKVALTLSPHKHRKKIILATYCCCCSSFDSHTT